MGKRRIKTIAIFLNLLFVHHLVAPAYLYALTSGPASPEFTGFTPAGASELVNAFTGDFSYNIPLMDVGGYPVNLAYNAGVSMDQEASWVGLGWNINPGAINRQVRGLPDDFSGDAIKKEFSMKNNHSFGVKAQVKAEFAGFGDKAQGFEELRKRQQALGEKVSELNNRDFVSEYKAYKLIAGSQALEFNNWLKRETDDLNKERNELEALEDKEENLDMEKSVSPFIGFSYNNYKGVGLEVGVTLGSMIQKKNDAGLGHNASLDLSFGTQNGIGVNMSGAGMASQFWRVQKTERYGIKGFGGGLSYNSREGVTSVGFNRQKTGYALNSVGAIRRTQGGYGLSYGFVSPNSSFPDYPMKNFGFTMGYEPGGESGFAKAQPSFKGYYSGQFFGASEMEYNAFGFLYMEKHEDLLGDYSKGTEHYLMDYAREGDKPLSRDVPNLPIPVLTPDIYIASGQGMGMSFRAHRYDNGVVHDPDVRNTSDNRSGELDMALGGTADWGADIGMVVSLSNKGKWSTGNITDNFSYKTAEATANEYSKPYYFKASADMALMDQGYYNSMNGSSMLRPKLKDALGMFIRADNVLVDDDGFTASIGADVTGNATKPDLQHNIVGLTALEAASYGLQREIEYYNEEGEQATTPRFGSEEGYEKETKHISEFHITKPDGSEYVYGLPVYNTKARQVSFSLEADDTYSCDKLVDYSAFNEVTGPGHSHGHDRYFHSEETPAYAAAHLITGILSPDYEDLTGNGISDDDHGSAVKFHYSKQGFGTSDVYRYRTPYEENKAKVNEGLKSDPYDNKASYSYGEKEVYYLHSIESKNFIAKFILNELTGPDAHIRNDGYGVTDEDGGLDATQSLRRLERIELYSKEDLAKNGASAVAIKTVHFDYDYSLCTNIPNGQADVGNAGGKLTLKKVWFTYGTSSRGRLSSYQFEYPATNNPSYDQNATDRWGNYVPKETDPCDDLSSFPVDEFPYAQQTKAQADENAAAWNLNKITLPSGGTIEVSYEADDYSHVQDQQALRMFGISNTYAELPTEASNASGNVCRLYEHSGDNKDNYTYLQFDLEEELDGTVYTTQELADAAVKALYGNMGAASANKLFYQCEVYVNPDKDPDLADKREVISGYANITSWGALKTNSGNTNYDKAYVKLTLTDLKDGSSTEGEDGVQPIAFESWNYFRKHLNKYVNQISEPKTSGITDASNNNPLGSTMKIFRELVNSYGQELRRMFQGVNRMMRGSGFAEKIVAGRSMIRLSEPDGIKHGGGHRVSAIRIADQWKDLTGGIQDELDGVYGQDYDYSTWDREQGRTISSGVAANEPMIGWEECALKQYDEVWEQKKILAASSYTSFERPYGYSFLPGASVGYRTVSTSAYNPTGHEPSGANKIERTATGKTVQEYYTTKDYPTITLESEVDQEQSVPISPRVKMFSYRNNVLGLAQGYLIHTNDMNGRPKATHTYGEGATEFDVDGRRINGLTHSAYEYSLGSISTLRPDGSFEDREDCDIDFVIESTRTRSRTVSMQVQVQVEVVTPPVAPFIVPAGSVDKSEVRYLVSTKHVHRRAHLVKVTNSNRGIQNEALNTAWDPMTGGVLLSQTENEFEDPAYSLSLPGHWAYKRLQAESKRQGRIFDNTSLDGSNNVVNINALAVLENGDKVVLRRLKPRMPMGHQVSEEPYIGLSEPMFWYLEGKLIDRAGEVLTTSEVNDKLGNNFWLEIIDPVERNQIGASIGGISSMDEVPITGTSLNSNARIMGASALEYKGRWRTHCCGFQMPFSGTYQYCGDGPCDVINPFVKGVLGNTRPYKTWTVYGDRISSYSASNDDVDVRMDGAIDGFELFWQYDAVSGYWTATTTAALWDYTSEITEYDEHGTEMETENRLEQKAAALLGYDEMVPIAAGQNAGYGDMAFDGFEDYNYKRIAFSNVNYHTATLNNKCYYDPHFGFMNPEKDHFDHLSEDYSHTGLRSLKVDPAVLTSNLLSLSFETADDNNEATVTAPFTLDKGDCFTRFYPAKNKSYSLSLWLREVDEAPDGYTDSEVSIAFYNASEILIGQTTLSASGDLIEGWQRVYGHFEIPDACESLRVNFKANGSTASYFDDVRIYPKHGAVTTHVYHPHTLRLTASLDANNFASFYEYDGEGGLIRVKKETEEGVVTLQESGKHIINNTP